jgi:L-ectoine synthase
VIVRRLEDIVGTEKEVGGDSLGWTSRRLLLKGDGMGFSLHDTLIHPRTPLHLHYKHHLEAVYMIEGKAKIRDSKSGDTHELLPGTVYALNGHEEHVLEAEVLSRFVCVFNPPVLGNEVHREDGSYVASE